MSLSITFSLLVVGILGSWLGATEVNGQGSSSGSQAVVPQLARAPSCSTNYQFDQFVLAIQWPLSFCYEKQDECNLTIARRKQWLIHGLWPNRSRRPNQARRSRRNSTTDNGERRGPSDIQFCCGPSFNASAIPAALYQELLLKWPTLNSNGRHDAFWRHEWQKHGTCSRQLTQLKTQQAYFETVLDLYNCFNLNRAQLRSNETYQLDQLHRAIEPLVGGKRVRLECSLGPNPKAKRNTEVRRGGGGGGNAAAKTSIFLEVHICLDKQLQPMDCGRKDDQQCKRRVLFP